MRSEPLLPVTACARVLGARWTLQIIHYLRETRRFGELQDLVGGINPTTLSQRLRFLEGEGLIRRRPISDAPSRVTYELTESGRELLPILNSLVYWAEKWLMNTSNPSSIPMAEERFLSGFTWSDYRAQMKVNRELVIQLFDEITLPAHNQQTFARLVASYGGRLHVVALTEDWCGDAAVVLPLIARLAREVPGMDLRLFVRSSNPGLEQAYAAQDVTRIPVLSFFNDDWNEVGRWVERSAAANRRVEAWMAAHPQSEILRQSARPQDRRAFRALLRERLREMVHWYREGLWMATLEELEALLSSQD